MALIELAYGDILLPVQIQKTKVATGSGGCPDAPCHRKIPRSLIIACWVAASQASASLLERHG